MTEILQYLLQDKKTELVFKCFSPFHFVFIGVIISIIVVISCVYKNKDKSIHNKILNITIGLAFGLYILDFFLMPFAYNEIDIEKLPFHICTLTCLLCFLSRNTKLFGKFKKEFMIIGLIGNFIYLIYPAGVGWAKVHPLSYRVIQTLLFHGIMSAYGIFGIVFNDIELKLKNIYNDLIVILAMVLWALIGNYCYNGLRKTPYNWMFVVEDPFRLLPNTISPYIMPFVIVAILLLCVLIVHGVTYLIRIVFLKMKKL